MMLSYLHVLPPFTIHVYFIFSTFKRSLKTYFFPQYYDRIYTYFFSFLFLSIYVPVNSFFFLALLNNGYYYHCHWVIALTCDHESSVALYQRTDSLISGFVKLHLHVFEIE